MATSHPARRRQRTASRRTSAHARTHGTRQNRAAAPGNVTHSPAPALAAPARAETEAPARPRVAAAEVATETARPAAKPIRTPDSDDHLAAYFRQLAEHELLTPEDERELSQGIEDTEIMTWERVFARADVVAPLLALVEPNLEQPVKFPKLVKQAEDMLKTKKAQKDSRQLKKLAGCAKDVAGQLRGLDLDRVHIDAVVRELYRAREAALAGVETWWTDGSSKDAGAYVDEVRQAHRDAANLRDEFVRAREGKRPQQNRVDGRENGAIGAYPES